MSAIQASGASKTQTLLTVDATYNDVVAAIGPPSAPEDTDKQWHCWNIPTGDGTSVRVYDFHRPTDGATDPAQTPDRPTTWRINAIGDEHEQAAQSIAATLADPDPDPLYSAIEVLFRNRHELPPDALRSLGSIWMCASAARYGGHYEPFWEDSAEFYAEHDVLKCEEESGPGGSTFDARTMPCTALAVCDDGEPVTFGGVAVVNYRAELSRRGEGHVFTCAGIYPTGYSPDGTALFEGPVCTYGSEVDDGKVEATGAERLCGVLYTEAVSRTSDPILGSLTAAELTDLVGHYQMRRCPSCTEVAHAAVLGEIGRRPAPGEPADPGTDGPARF